MSPCDSVYEKPNCNNFSCLKWALVDYIFFVCESILFLHHFQTYLVKSYGMKLN